MMNCEKCGLLLRIAKADDTEQGRLYIAVCKNPACDMFELPVKRLIKTDLPPEKAADK